VVALSIAATLAIFLIYTAFVGSSIAAIKPSQLPAHKDGKVQLVGTVVGPVRTLPNTQNRRFAMEDIGGHTTVPVVYSGAVGALFKVGQHILVTGRLRGGVFVADRDSMITKCPSKYIPKKNA
jgi:cytochrome c-type biogenesis protein CcmE